MVKIVLDDGTEFCGKGDVKTAHDCIGRINATSTAKFINLETEDNDLIMFNIDKVKYVHASDGELWTTHR